MKKTNKTSSISTNSLVKIVKKSKRIGRGYGSGVGGHTSTRGSKGQKSRAGYHVRKGFEGGQSPLIKKLPRLKGNKSINEKPFTVDIKFVLLKNVYDISQEKLTDLTGYKLVKLVGVKDYSEIDLSKVTVREDVLITKKLREIILENKGTVEAKMQEETIRATNAVTDESSKIERKRNRI